MHPKGEAKSKNLLFVIFFKKNEELEKEKIIQSF